MLRRAAGEHRGAHAPRELASRGPGACDSALFVQETALEALFLEILEGMRELIVLIRDAR